MDYHQLRQAESEILAGFLTHVRLRTLASNTFSWADEIPQLIETPDLWTPGAPVNGSQDRADAWPRWDGGLAYGGVA
jgi:hypothetical protein